MGLESAIITFPILRLSMNPPRFISIFGFNIYLYGIIMAAGFLLGMLYLLKRHAALGITRETVFDMVLLAIPSGIIGSRIYYVIFNPSEFFGASGRWQDIFNVRLGGLAIYGGVLGAAVAFFVYSRIKKVPMSKLADAGAFGLFIGQIVGRWGNFINREAFGVETTGPWRMGLTTAAGTMYVHPTFLYESLWNIVGLIFLHVFSKKRKVKYNGQLFLIYVAWYGFGRFFIEGLRADSLFLASTNIRASQLLAALSFAVAVAAMVYNRKRVASASVINDAPPHKELESLVEDSGDTPDDI